MLTVVVGILLGVGVLTIARAPQPWLGLLAGMLLLPFTLLIVRDATRFLVAITLLEITLPLDIYLFHRPELAELNANAGLNVSVTTICLGLLYAQWFFKEALGLSEMRGGWLTAVLPYVVYVSVASLSLIVARDLLVAGFELNLLLQALLLMIFLVAWVRSRAEALFVVQVLVAGLFVQAMIMIGLVLLGSDVSIGSISARIDPGPRVAGTVGSPNAAASYLTLFLPTALALWVTTSRPLVRLMAFGAFGLGLIALVLTQSRGGWTGFLVAMSILVLAGLSSGRISMRVVLGALIPVAAAVGLVGGVITQRLTSESGSDPTTRVILVRLALDVARDHPLLGVGANNFALVLPEYVTPEYSPYWISTVHNRYILILSETGVLGLTAFVWFLLSTLSKGWTVWKYGSRGSSAVALALVAGLAGVAVHMNLDIFHGRPQTQLIAVAAGVLLALWLNYREAEERSRPETGTALTEADRR